MLTAAQSSPRRTFAPRLDPWVDALTGPRRQAAVALTLLAYGGGWTIYRIVATFPRDIHFDMSELYAWSLTPAFGYDKHPPLSALIVHVWFWVFPVSDWSFTLLAVGNIVLTLFIAWHILDRWTDPAKAAFGLALLTLIPFYNFHALKYNANTVLLPVWALTAYAFLRAFETRSALWSVIAGAAAGAAMLGKYWSIFLVAGLVLAALIDRRRLAFLKSPAPYLMVAAGGLVLAPHIYWIERYGADTLTYAGARLQGRTFFSLGSAAKFVGGFLAYGSVALTVWALLLKVRVAALKGILNPDDPQRRLALLSLLLPNLLPMLAARWVGFELTPLWTLPGFSLLPLVLLATPQVRVDRRALRWVLSIAAAVTLAAVALSPLVALAIHTRENARPSDYGTLLARDVAARWETLVQDRLPLVFSCGKSPDVALAVAYDLRLPARTLYGKPGLGARAELLSQGGAIVGPASDPDCLQTGEAAAAMRPRTERIDATYRPTLFGIAGRPFSYTAYIVPPP